MNLRQFELLKHTRVQDTKDTNGVVLTTKVQLNSGRVSSKEGWIYDESVNLYVF